MRSIQGNIIESLHIIRDSQIIIQESINWRDDFISSDSYQNSKEFQDIWKENRKAFDDKERLWNQYKENQDIMKRDGTPKPRAEWDDEDEWRALIGDKPMKYSSDKIAGLRKVNDDIMKQIHELDKIYADTNEKLDIIKAHAAKVEKKNHRFSKPKKATKSDYKGFDMTDMGVSYYNDLMERGRGYIAEMSPREYLLRCAFQIFDGTIESCLNGVIESNAQKYANKMKSGEKFHMPYLNFRDRQQEGRHRAVAAYLNGIKLIPVFIID